MIVEFVPTPKSEDVWEGSSKNIKVPTEQAKPIDLENIEEKNAYLLRMVAELRDDKAKLTVDNENKDRIIKPCCEAQ